MEEESLIQSGFEARESGKRRSGSLRNIMRMRKVAENRKIWKSIWKKTLQTRHRKVDKSFRIRNLNKNEKCRLVYNF